MNCIHGGTSRTGWDRDIITGKWDRDIITGKWDRDIITGKWFSSVLVMGHRIDPSWGGPIELFLFPASAPRLV